MIGTDMVFPNLREEKATSSKKEVFSANKNNLENPFKKVLSKTIKNTRQDYERNENLDDVSAKVDRETLEKVININDKSRETIKSNKKEEIDNLLEEIDI